MMKTDNCESLEANRLTVIRTVSVASMPEVKAKEEREEVEEKVCAKADAQK